MRHLSSVSSNINYDPTIKRETKLSWRIRKAVTSELALRNPLEMDVHAVWKGILGRWKSLAKV